MYIYHSFLSHLYLYFNLQYMFPYFQVVWPSVFCFKENTEKDFTTILVQPWRPGRSINHTHVWVCLFICILVLVSTYPLAKMEERACRK